MLRIFAGTMCEIGKQKFEISVWYIENLLTDIYLKLFKVDAENFWDRNVHF